MRNAIAGGIAAGLVAGGIIAGTLLVTQRPSGPMSPISETVKIDDLEPVQVQLAQGTSFGRGSGAIGTEEHPFYVQAASPFYVKSCENPGMYAIQFCK
jgi:hypothetical protein